MRCSHFSVHCRGYIKSPRSGGCTTCHTALRKLSEERWNGWRMQEQTVGFMKHYYQPEQLIWVWN